MKLKNNRRTANTFFLFIAAVLFSSVTQASPVIDGNVQSSDGYDYTYILNMTEAPDKKGNFKSGVAGGYSEDFTLKLDQTGNELSVGLIAPLTINDNNYGSIEGYRNGWDVEGVSKEHTFKNLTSKGNKIKGKIDGVNFDYKYNTTANTSLAWNFSNINEVGGDDFTVDSPETTGDGTYTVVNNAYNEWLFKVMYEFKITLTSSDMLDFSEAGVQEFFDITEWGMSPSKYGDIKFENPVVMPSVPLPTAVFLFGTALVGLLGFRKTPIKIEKIVTTQRL